MQRNVSLTNKGEIKKNLFIKFLVFGKHHTQTALHDFQLETKDEFEADIVAKVPKNKNKCHLR